MGIYDINFRKFATGLLPIALRGSVKELAVVLCGPFKRMHARFRRFRSERLWYMGYNGTAVSMEAMLNDYFRDEVAQLANGNRILVCDGASVSRTLVYPEAEQLPLTVGTVTITPASVWGAVPFVVRVPSELQGDTDIYNGIDRLVRIFKLAGTKHTIEYYG